MPRNPRIGSRVESFLPQTPMLRKDPYEARLLRLSLAVFDYDIPALPVEFCSPTHSEHTSCVPERGVAGECGSGRPESSRQDSRQLRQVAAELRGQSRAG